MNIQLLLKGNNTYSWTNSENLYFLGYFFDSHNQLYKGDMAIEFILQELKGTNLEDFCNSIKGAFTFIIISENDCQLISDSINFFPLFYGCEDDKLIVSDQWNEIIQYRKKFKLNNKAVDEFETAGFVLSNETLEESIFKTNANQILKINRIESEIIQYKNFITNDFSEKSFDELAEEAETVILNIGDRLLKFLNGRTAVVPLSGGFDSRLIVSLLKRLNYKKVICITYGKENPEVSLSKAVAKELGYDWHFVDYAKINIDEIQSEPLYQEYVEYASNGFAMPYLMEYFAVAYLMKNGILPKESVFLPGHSGDFLGGSYINKTVKNEISFKRLAAFIESKYFNFVQKNNRKRKWIQDRIDKSLIPIGKSFIHDGYNMTIEEWDIQEKLAKFIFHSSHVFTFYRFEHYFPLWDKELVNFYRNVPFKYREGKKLYDYVLVESFFTPFCINFPKKEELSVAEYVHFFQKIKDAVRYFFPWKIVLQRINNADWPYYQLLTQRMMRSIEENQGKPFTHFKTYNAVISNWYIQFLKEKYRTF
ncbi:asparagine synthetase B family protein [Chryseobacterium nematophagum]|uniref:asparagine synthase (glutamine-hydrolyzing) n=1 Tax=Chryseobacterium nematophagum TaxID=2305228 RepID=A0A3M7LD07_9FLAO|nr:asparagine synthase C-terminal domain-containing protein [Chryseobacterium nematophagum]RMZ60601.1 asparagine synthetase B family protein [Chryseobacterium nematophagum]